MKNLSDAIVGALRAEGHALSSDRLFRRVAERVPGAKRADVELTAVTLGWLDKLQSVYIVGRGEWLEGYKLPEQRCAPPQTTVLPRDEGEVELVRCCLHEAAHAVVAIAAGGDVVGLSVREDGGGGVNVRFRAPAPGRAPARQTAMFQLAGIVAEQHFFERPPHPRCIREDERRAAACVPREQLPRLREQVFATVVERADEILAVALELYRKRRADGGRVLKLVEQARRSNAD
ncbi:: Peptidase_M50B [Gemmataceae bacterium]|nr:: Peptidase_M50B [Gemmataceae bacterium]VTT98866.1 : Peptidase_M50B [Gemmataceae bacterium]